MMFVRFAATLRAMLRTTIRVNAGDLLLHLRCVLAVELLLSTE